MRSQTETAKRYRYTGKERDEEEPASLPRRAVLRAMVSRGLQAVIRAGSSTARVYAYVRCKLITGTDSSGLGTSNRMTAEEFEMS